MLCTLADSEWMSDQLKSNLTVCNQKVRYSVSSCVTRVHCSVFHVESNWTQPLLASDLPGIGFKDYMNQAGYKRHLMVSNDQFGSIIAICFARGKAASGRSRRPFTWDDMFPGSGCGCRSPAGALRPVPPACRQSAGCYEPAENQCWMWDIPRWICPM